MNNNDENSIFRQCFMDYLNCGDCVNTAIQDCVSSAFYAMTMSKEDEFTVAQQALTNFSVFNNLPFLSGRENQYSFEESQVHENMLLKINDSDTTEQKNCKTALNSVFNEKIGIRERIEKMIPVIANYQRSMISNKHMNNNNANYNPNLNANNNLIKK